MMQDRIGGEGNTPVCEESEFSESDKKRMKIGINITSLQNDLRFRGPGSYTRQLIKALLRNNEDHQFIGISYQGRFRAGGTVLSDSGEPGLSADWRIPYTSLLKQQLLVPAVVKRFAFDIWHEPMQTATLWQPLPTVITVFDLIPFIFPEKNDFRRKILNIPCKISSRRALRIITISEASRNDIIHYFKIPPERIRVIYPAADERFFPEENRKKIEPVLRKFGIKGRYILYVGGIDTQKNVFDMMETFIEFHKDFPGVQLVVVGKAAKETPCIKEWIIEHGLDASILLPGYASDGDLRRLYSGALFYFSLTLYEGFGLPFLEALSCGTPVVGYSTGSVPEAVGDGGLLLPAGDRKAVVDSMRLLTVDDSLRREFAEKAEKHVEKFSWDNCGRKTMEVYEDLFDDLRAERAR